MYGCGGSEQLYTGHSKQVLGLRWRESRIRTKVGLGDPIILPGSDSPWTENVTEEHTFILDSHLASQGGGNSHTCLGVLYDQLCVPITKIR